MGTLPNTKLLSHCSNALLDLVQTEHVMGTSEGGSVWELGKRVRSPGKIKYKFYIALVYSRN